MGIIARVKGWFEMLLKGKAREDFQVEEITPDDMKCVLGRCADIYKGSPPWVDTGEHIKTVNFAKAVCSETARLATLAIGIQIDGSQRAKWLQEQLDKVYFQLRPWVEYGCAFGTVLLKPNGESIDLFPPDRFMVTGQSDGEITGVVFLSQQREEKGKKWFTRLEYHRFLENGLYAVTNKCYIGDSPNGGGKPVPIEKTPWAGLLEEVTIANVERPLYGVLRMPHANNLSINSPLSLPIFSDAIEELKDLDIAYSRNAKEIQDSKRLLLLDSDRLLLDSGPAANTADGFKRARETMGLPDYVKNVYGDGRESFYQEINPTLQTDVRLAGINALLSQIGYKCGFSNGYFVFNESTGIQTATGVEAEQQRTVQFIKDVRDKLETCLDGLIYAINVFADLYSLAPAGAYSVTYDFGDILYNATEDKTRWYGYVTAGMVPFWYFLTKFEGFSEQEAQALEKAAKPKGSTLFEEE